MTIDRIISLANARSRIQFLAMERSLRACGCTLSIDVIPYDKHLFDLPSGSRWWSVPSVLSWLGRENAHPMMRKYQCLTTGRYQYVDSDVCFLIDPAAALRNYDGWIVCCTEWNKPRWTYTDQSARLMSLKSSTWQRSIFNAGQFACDRALYSEEELVVAASRPEMFETCVRCEIHDQPGLNLLVFASGVPVTNLTLPPRCLESTWAGDYPGEYESLWKDVSRKPYLIHWAGSVLDWDRPINEIFYEFLTNSERAEWVESQRGRRARQETDYRRQMRLFSRFSYDAKQAARRVLKTLYNNGAGGLRRRTSSIL